MARLEIPHYMTKSFWCMGRNLPNCYSCKYCRLLDESTKDVDIMTRPTDVNPILAKVPIVVNIFYGDPLLQIDRTLEIIESLDEAKHQGPVIVITKGDFKKFPRIDTKLDLHFAFSTFGKNHELDGGTMERFISNLDEAKSRGKHKYSIEFRPIIYGVNDDIKTIDTIMELAIQHSLPIGYSGLQGKPGVVEHWRTKGVDIQPFPGSTFGYKKFLPQELEKYITSFGVPTFKKSSCLISFVHNLERDYNAHYYRPNELNCKNCVMFGRCSLFYRGLPLVAYPLPELPFEYEVVYAVNRTCMWFHKGCSFPSDDCKHLSGYFIKLDKDITTSDVRMIKWLTGMTVIADFVESPYLSSFWLKN